MSLFPLIYEAREGRDCAFPSLLHLQGLVHGNCSGDIYKRMNGFPRGDHEGPGKRRPLPTLPASLHPAPGLTVFLIEQILDLLPQRVGNVDPGQSGIIIFCKVKTNYGSGLLKGT